MSKIYVRCVQTLGNMWKLEASKTGLFEWTLEKGSYECSGPKENKPSNADRIHFGTRCGCFEEGDKVSLVGPDWTIDSPQPVELAGESLHRCEVNMVICYESEDDGDMYVDDYDYASPYRVSFCPFCGLRANRPHDQ